MSPSLSSRADNDTATPFPYYIWTPSGQFEGVDGNWSTFFINVGDDESGEVGQSFRILPSTAGSLTIVPGTLTNNWCEDYPGGADACSDARGINIYQGAVSDGFKTDHPSWRFNVNGVLNTGIEVDFGADQNATYGSDNVGFGIASVSSPMVGSAPVAVTQSREFFLGLFGLSNRPLNILDVAYETFLPTYKKGGNINTLSYSYTAGSVSANGGKKVPGSLILGGHDLSRYNPSKMVPVAMPAGEDSSLIVGVRSVTVDANSSPVSVGGSFNAMIDSTLPYFWFPQEICESIAEQFDLQYDDETDLYVPQNRGANQGKRLTIQIGNSVGDGANWIDISLPYASLDLDASFPLVNETGYKYFPLKNGSSDSYVLGRAFLQHAYIIVDYDQHNFTVAEATYRDPMPSSTVVPIFPSGYDYPSQDPNNPGSGGLSGAAKGGIAGGVVGGFLLLLAVGAFFFFRRRKSKKQEQQKIDEKGYYPPAPGSPPPGYPADKPPNTRRVSELEDGSSRSTSAQGYYSYGHRRSESGSNITELMGSPPMGSDEKAYLKQAALETEPAPLAELPGDHGLSELPQARRPKPKRHRSSGSGGSNGRVQSPDSERPDPIQEEEHSPIERRVMTPEVLVTHADETHSSSRVESPDPEELTRGTTNTAMFSETSLEAQTQRTEMTTATSVTRESSQSEITHTKSGSGLLS